VKGKTYRLEMVKCGKKHCGKCPHGPYWYEYDHGRIYTRKRYVGKELPEHIRAQLSARQKLSVAAQEQGFASTEEDE
jgi:hypothetical protein